VGVVIAVALAIAVMGIDLTNIALVAGALSVGIGFGLQNVVNNFVSGLILLVERPIKVGDWVVIGGKEGFVKRVNFRATEVETWQRASVIIPNAEILSTAVTNWTHKDRYGRIEIRVGVAYGSDVDKVRDVLLTAAREHERVLDYPEPFVLFMDFGDSSLNFELRCFTADVLYRPRIASDLRFEIDHRFRDQGIEIPFPQRVVHMVPQEG
jgi:small-conductance mechanosensitive channel